jgi:arylsulfatase A-like enzyme
VYLKFSLSLITFVLALLGSSEWMLNPVLAQGSAQGSKRKPNIVLINLDDCDVDLVNKQRLENFPMLEKLASQSVRFTNCHATTPLCGPSRACLFRCQYAHNTGYRTNRANLDAGSGFTGGTQYFMDSGLANDQLSVWMKNAGYHTMLVGKYFQGETEHVPVPGWDRFVAFGGNRYIDRITIFDFYQDGTTKAVIRDGYRTDLEADETIGLIDEYAKTVDPEKPFFLYLAPVAPHVGPMRENSIPQRWKDRFPTTELPRCENFNEADVSDKPLVYRDILPMSPGDMKKLRDTQRYRMIAMLGIDEMVRRVREKIAAIGQEENTVIILTSDHGYLMGQHRIHGKSFPLIESTKVPLWVYDPQRRKSRTANQLLAHIDIAATVAELGGAGIPEFADGRSFVSLLSDESIAEEDAIRQSVLVENWESRLQSASKQKVVYSSIIKPNSIYTQWANGEREFYKLDSDPSQLNNAWESLDASQRSLLQGELHSLRQNTSRNSETTVSISFPTVNRKFAGPDIELSGFIESTSQPETARVSIQRKETGEYWNGSSWQEERVTIETESPPQPGLLNMWRVKPNFRQLNPGEVLLIEGHAELPVSEKPDSVRKLEVVFDSQPPKVSVTRPLNQHAYPEFSNFGGLITDDHGSESVQLVVYDLKSKKYFDGEQWLDESCYAPVFVNAKLGRWHAKHSLPEGSYEVYAIGKDSAGNWSRPESKIRIVVDQAIKARIKLADPVR